MVDVTRVMTEALEAANKAGDEWVAKTLGVTVEELPQIDYRGKMLDLCGNAYIKFTDKRTKVYKEFKARGFVRGYEETTIDIWHKHSANQAHGLAVKCANAMLAVFKAHGINCVSVYDYID